MKVHELSQCPSCGDDRSTPVVLGGADGEHTLRRCATCHLTYAGSYADWHDVYTSGYLTGETAFGLDVSDDLFQDALDFIADKRLRFIERVTGGPSSILDVGCGSGEVLRNALRRGWTATGVEPVAESAETARRQGIDVRATTLEESGLPEHSFGVVSAYHVLEHMPEGTAFLQTLARWAQPGGLVAIEVPNFRSLHRRNMGSSWPGLRPLEHVAHYSPETLRSTLERAGLEPIKVRTMGFLWRRQTLHHMLGDLGQWRWHKVLERLSHRTEQDGKTVWHASAPVRVFLLGAQAAYDRAQVGQVVVALGRVPA